MNKNFSIILVSMFLGLNVLAEPAKQPNQQRGQMREKIQHARQSGKLPAHKSAAPKSGSHGKAASSPKHQEHDKNIDSLIEKFHEAVSKIPKKSEKGQADNHKEYKEHVNKAFEAYKKLFDYNKEHKPLISQEQNKKVKDAAIPLFNARNIQHMVWHGHVERTTAPKSAGHSNSTHSAH